MGRLVNLLRREPALAGGIITAGVSLGAAFGFNLSAEAVASIAAIIGTFLGVQVRANVTPLDPGGLDAQELLDDTVGDLLTDEGDDE